MAKSRRVTTRVKFTRTHFERHAPANGRDEVRDSESPLILLVTAKGHKSLCVRPRLGAGPSKGVQLRLFYPKAAVIGNLSDARQWARQSVDACKAGIDPREAAKTAEEATTRATERTEHLTFENVVKRYVERRLRREKQNRTADKSERIFGLYVTPQWRGRLITEIRRKDVNALLDDVFDRKIKIDGTNYGGSVVVDRVLAQVRALFNWYATQDDDFTSPIVRGMARTKPRERARDRVLSDEEIRLLWSLLSKLGTFGAIVKMLLLTGQRRDEVGFMTRAEIDANGVWTIPAERFKNKKPNVIPLSADARAVIAAQPVAQGCDFVFTANGQNRFGDYSKSKRRLDKALLVKLSEAAAERGDDATKVTLPDWRLHDLRRTAKTLMVRAGVRPDISERVLGHVIAGVEGVYDRHGYVEEKRAALEALAALLHRIVNPSTHNVVALREAAQ
jgi:integrase